MEPVSEFANPITKLYGAFTYDKMVDGVQWTALWVRLSDAEILCMETKPWDGSTGGYGYTDCEPSSDQWTAGEYEVQIYVGTQWNNSGRFMVTGNPPAPTVTRTPTRTATATRTITSTPTPSPTRTATPTFGPSPTLTITLTWTPTLTFTVTMTPTVTRTRPPTSTLWPTRTPRITDTRWPSPTP